MRRRCFRRSGRKSAAAPNAARQLRSIQKGGILAHAEIPLTAAEAKTLLTKGTVRKTGLHSTRTNARYDAVLHLDFDKDGRAILRPRFD